MMTRNLLRAVAAQTFAASVFLWGGLPLSATALPLISEVLYDATGADNGLVFVEIYGAPGTVLDGLSLDGINGSNGAVTPSLLLSGVIPPDGFFVVADDVGDGTTLVSDADLVLNFDFQNGDQTQARSRAYAVLLRRIGRICASAQSCVCQ